MSTEPSTQAPELPERLPPSALGTKEYWDHAYDVELANHATNPDDEGTIWFEDSGAEEKMLEYLQTIDLDGESTDHVSNKDLRIVDLGTGNGHLLFAMQDDGWMAKMTGVDYSRKSIDLARQIQSRRREDRDEGDAQDSSDIAFEHWDLIQESPGVWFGGGFDVALDKGTFDAISLSGGQDDAEQSPCKIYARKVEQLLKPGGCLLITSCNWTEAELRKWLESPRLAYHDTLKFPSFTFGGVKGQTVSSICFRRTDEVNQT